MRRTLLAVALSSLFMAPVSAQTLGIEYVNTWAGYDGLLEKPSGIIATLDVPVARTLALRMGFTYRTENLVTVRSPCVGLVPANLPCAEEVMDGDTSLRGALFGLVITENTFASLLAEVSLYALVMGGEVQLVSRESGRTLSPSDPEAGIGAGFGFALGYPVGERFVVKGSARGEFPGWRDRVILDGWAPFDGSRLFGSLGLGVSYRVGG